MPEISIQATALTLPDEPLFSGVRESLSLSKREAQKFYERLWRFSAHVRQPRKDDRSCNKTPYFDRWNIDPVMSYLTPDDARYADRNECEQIFHALLVMALEAEGAVACAPQVIAQAETLLGRELRLNTLRCLDTDAIITRDDITRALAYSTSQLGAYEIPVTYRVSLDASGQHRQSNVGWMKPLHINYALRAELRAHLASLGVSSKPIDNVLNKIQVKAYATDKQTMPPYFSNRDVRWATWPESTQYASHYDCARVEMELLVELFEFAGAPLLSEATQREIQATRGKPMEPELRRCFVTGALLRFDEYVNGAVNPEGGKSAYNVGHLMPLTRGGKHHWQNIAWISGDGNRIQGNDTLAEIEDKLYAAVEYYLERDMMLDARPQYLQAHIEKLQSLLDAYAGGG